MPEWENVAQTSLFGRWFRTEKDTEYTIMRLLISFATLSLSVT